MDRERLVVENGKKVRKKIGRWKSKTDGKILVIKKENDFEKSVFI